MFMSRDLSVTLSTACSYTTYFAFIPMNVTYMQNMYSQYYYFRQCVPANFKAHSLAPCKQVSVDKSRHRVVDSQSCITVSQHSGSLLRSTRSGAATEEEHRTCP